MKKLIECVPNISEGRNVELIEDVISKIETVPGATLLEWESDADLIWLEPVAPGGRIGNGRREA